MRLHQADWYHHVSSEGQNSQSPIYGLTTQPKTQISIPSTHLGTTVVRGIVTEFRSAKKSVHQHTFLC